MAWNGGTSKWESTDTINYGGASGVAKFWVSNGIPYLTINGNYLVLDAAGTTSGVHYADWSGGEATGFTAAATQESCGGNTFRVRLTCACCTTPTTVTTTGAGTWVATCDTIDVECWGPGGNGG